MYLYIIFETNMVSDLPRAHRSQRDKVPVCQDWLDLDFEHTLNTIDSMDTWTEPVDGKQKVCFFNILLLNITQQENVNGDKTLEHQFESLY